MIIGQTIYETKGSDVYKVNKVASINQIAENKEHWEVQLKSFTPSENKSMITREELSRLKEEANKIHKNIAVNRGNVDAPLMNINFEGNRGTGSVPPDNTIAVSDNGFIITSINSNIIFTRADGKITYNAGLADFFTDLGLGSFFDPKVLFDAEAKRFIVVALSGSKANVSAVAVAFSQTEDPSMGWNFYKLKGDILSESVWFDYPNIGITDHELFICGNMFTDANAFRYSSIYQVSKIDGYAGSDLSVKHYTKMKEPVSGQNFFNFTPCPAAWSDNLPSSMGFLTNDIRGGNIIVYAEITGNLESNPSFKIVNAITTDQYNPPQDASMKGSSDKLETFDCRIMYGININGVIHFVYKVSGNGYAAINYSRLDLATKKLDYAIYAEPDMHVSYPSIMAFGSGPNDTKVLINYLRSSETIFPEQAAIVCEGEGNNFMFSDPVLIRKGDTFVAALDGTVERWGDYSSVSRRFSNEKPEVWVSGCFGRSRFGSWTAQFINKSDAFYDFYSDKTVLNPGDTIAFSTIGTDSLINVTFALEGANYLDGFDSLYAASYDSIGSYDAVLTALNQNGDTIRITKHDFIHVVPVVFVPVADFVGDKTSIFEGDSVSFTDLSTNNPKRWKWSFSGGTPNASEQQNPTIKYLKKGSFATVLNAKNTAGEDVEVKPKYITVSARPLAPVADFIADKTNVIVNDSVQFTDLSVNAPTSWQWIVFNATESDTFVNQNPKITFKNIGTYSVTLISTNDVGADTITKENYILAGPNSNQNINWLLNAKLYPNPVTASRISLEFELPEALDLSFNVIDAKGNLIKKLIEKSVKSGRNELSFNTDMLSGGNYLLTVHVPGSSNLKSYKFTVLK